MINLIDGNQQTKDHIKQQWETAKAKKFVVQVKKGDVTEEGVVVFKSALDFNFVPAAGHLTVGEYAISISEEADPLTTVYSTIAKVKSGLPIRLKLKWGEEEKPCSFLREGLDFHRELIDLAVAAFPQLQDRKFELSLYTGAEFQALPMCTSRDVFQLSNDSVIIITIPQIKC